MCSASLPFLSPPAQGSGDSQCDFPRPLPPRLPLRQPGARQCGREGLGR